MKQHLTPFLLMFLGLVAPIKVLAIAIGFLVAIDLLTGIWASWNEGKAITSQRLRHTVKKTTSYLVGLIVAHVADQYVFMLPYTLKAASGVMASVELYSIYENLTRISGVDLKSVIKEKLASRRPASMNAEDTIPPPPKTPTDL